MTERKDDTSLHEFVCTPERRKRVYRAAAERLQRFADANPDVRHDADTPEINSAIESINEALLLFMQGKCERERVSAAFDRYEKALLDSVAGSVRVCAYSKVSDTQVR